MGSRLVKDSLFHSIIAGKNGNITGGRKSSEGGRSLLFQKSHMGNNGSPPVNSFGNLIICKKRAVLMTFQIGVPFSFLVFLQGLGIINRGPRQSSCLSDLDSEREADRGKDQPGKADFLQFFHLPGQLVSRQLFPWVVPVTKLGPTRSAAAPNPGLLEKSGQDRPSESLI
jgi:hypothetical protein